MATKEELLARIVEGDEDAAKELEELITSLEGGVATAERNLKLKTDKALRERYPRALRVFDMGKFTLDTNLSDEQLAQALKDKEDELAELGVPLSTEPVPEPKAEEPKGEEVPAKVTENKDPAEAMAGAVGNSSPGGASRDEVHEVMELLKNGSTLHDQAKAFRIVAELNKANDKGKLKQINDMLGARPIIP